jgi:hypothetical protein
LQPALQAGLSHDSGKGDALVLERQSGEGGPRRRDTRATSSRSQASG